MNIGEIIKKRRLELGISQEELSKKMGYSSKTSISKIEKGISDIPLKKIQKLSNFLYIDILKLVKSDKEKNNFENIKYKNILRLLDKLEDKELIKLEKLTKEDFIDKYKSYNLSHIEWAVWPDGEEMFDTSKKGPVIERLKELQKEYPEHYITVLDCHV